MDVDDRAHLRCMVFESTSVVAREAFGSQEDNMWETQAEVERGTSDSTPFGYGTVWAQLESAEYEARAAGWDMDPEEVRAAYKLVGELDDAALEAWGNKDAPELVTSIREKAVAIAKAEQADTEEDDQEYVTCPKCNGKQGFANYRHVPHKHVGGLCFECDGYGVIPVADAAAFLRRQQDAEEARRAKEQARINERKAKEAAAHDAAFDRYGEEYRLVYALARYDHRATLGAAIDLNAYRANDKAAMRRVRNRLPYMVEDAGLDGLGLEEIEALGTLDPE